MLIIFKSKAAADIVMYKSHAEPILKLFGKTVEQGVITAEETAGAIARLEAEIAAGKQQAAEEKKHHPETDEEPEPAANQSVSFATRAFPLLDMLRAAHNARQFVMWGV
jgi:hypothetical protein